MHSFEPSGWKRNSFLTLPLLLLHSNRHLLLTWRVNRTQAYISLTGVLLPPPPLALCITTESYKTAMCCYISISTFSGWDIFWRIHSFTATRWCAFRSIYCTKVVPPAYFVVPSSIFTFLNQFSKQMSTLLCHITPSDPKSQQKTKSKSCFFQLDLKLIHSWFDKQFQSNTWKSNWDKPQEQDAKFVLFFTISHSTCMRSATRGATD